MSSRNIRNCSACHIGARPWAAADAGARSTNLRQFDADDVAPETKCGALLHKERLLFNEMAR
jgi:hypothetical protein